MTTKIPKSIGACIDLLYETRAKRLAAEKEIDALKAIESAISSHLMNNFDQAKIGGAKGKLAVASITRSDAPNVTNWDELYKFMIKKKRFDLLQKRVSITALKEHWDNGETVPGVEKIPVSKLSLTKIRAAGESTDSVKEKVNDNTKRTR